MQDQEQLRLLSIFNYVYGGLTFLFSLIPAIYLVIGLYFINHPEQLSSPSQGTPPPPEFGWMFAVMGGVGVLACWVVASLAIAAGRCIANRTNYIFCLVVAGIECLNMPLGTALGIFTFIVLMRESVKAQFMANSF